MSAFAPATTGACRGLAAEPGSAAATVLLHDRRHPRHARTGSGSYIISEETVDALRARPGKDIWLFGGGELFRSLLELDCVDTVEPAIMPVVLGAGRPLLPGPALQRRLTLTGQRLYRQSGIVSLTYDVAPLA